MNPDYEPMAFDIRCGECRSHLLYHKPFWECSNYDCRQKYTFRDMTTYRYLVLEGKPSLEEKMADYAQLKHFSVTVHKKKEK